MKRTINSTGRKRIPQERISVRLASNARGATPSFSISLHDVASLNLEPSSKVFVEAYVASSLMRFPFGTIAHLVPPADTTLTDLDVGGHPLFRVKVVDGGVHGGKIVASADGISPRDPGDNEGRKPLLPLRQTDLGEELWTFRISRDGGPELLVNNRIPGLADRIVSDPVFQGLVLPIAVRSILGHLFDPDEDSEWQRDWQAFAALISDEPIDWEQDPQEHGEMIEDLASRLVTAFCERQKYASRSIASLEGSAGE